MCRLVNRQISKNKPSMASPPNVFVIFAVPNFQIMNKVELYEQCKAALHVLNTRPLDLDEYPKAVNAISLSNSPFVMVVTLSFS